MSDKITYNKLVDLVTGKVDHSNAETERYLKALVDVINEGLERDGEVRIAKWGKFQLKWMDERPGYNPQTGERMTIPGHYRVTFSAYKPLREAVNEPYSHLEPKLLGGQETQDTAESGKSQSKTTTRESTPQESVAASEVISAERNKSEPATKRSVAAHRTQQRPERNRWILPLMLLLLVLIAASGYWIWRSPSQSTPGIAQKEQPALTHNTSTADQNAEGNQQQATKAPSNKKTSSKKDASPENTTYTVKNNDNLWGIAQDKLNDAYLWPWIYQKNDDVIPDPDTIYAGLQLDLPRPEGEAGNYSKSDSAAIARAYIQTYRYFNKHHSPRARYYLWAAHHYDKDIIKRVDIPVDQGDLAFVQSNL